MRELGLESCQPRPWRFSLTESDGQEHGIPDRVQRDFTAGAPGEKLVGDITYIPTWQGWLYLATVIDCHRHIRAQRRDPRQRRRRGTRLPHHRDIRLRLQQITHPPADHLMIIQQKHRDLPRRRAAAIRLARHRHHLTVRLRLRDPLYRTVS